MTTATPDTYRPALDQVCGDVIAAEAASVDEHGAFPATSLAALRDAGLLSAVSSVDVGGLGAGPRGAAAIVERIAMDCGSTAMVVCMHFCGTAVLEVYAGETVRREAGARRPSEHAGVQRSGFPEPVLGANEHGGA